MGTDATTRRGRAHLRLVPEADEWPEDLLPFIERARERMLAGSAPSPSPEVLAYLEESAYGKVDGDGTMVVPVDPELFELEAVSGPSHARRRRLVAAAGAAAALALVALGLRPVLTSTQQPEVSAPAVTAAAPSTLAPPSVAPSSAAPSSAALIGSRVDEVPAAPPAPTPTAVTSSVAPSADPVTVPAPAPTAPATVATPQPTKTTKPAPNPAPAATPAPAPAPVASPSEVVLAYFHAANARGRCVAHQPANADRAELIVACGPEQVPPPNLVQYWAARNTWLDCAQPLLDNGAAADKITDRCGAKPERAAYDVPANPYSTTSS